MNSKDYKRGLYIYREIHPDSIGQITSAQRQLEHGIENMGGRFDQRPDPRLNMLQMRAGIRQGTHRYVLDRIPESAKNTLALPVNRVEFVTKRLDPAALSLRVFFEDPDETYHDEQTRFSERLAKRRRDLIPFARTPSIGLGSVERAYAFPQLIDSVGWLTGRTIEFQPVDFLPKHTTYEDPSEEDWGIQPREIPIEGVTVNRVNPMPAEARTAFQGIFAARLARQAVLEAEPQ